MSRLLSGRADLVRALGAGGPEIQQAVAHLLGFERIETQTVQVTATDVFTFVDQAAVEIVAAPQAAVVDVPFWQADRFLAFEPRVLVPAKEEVVEIPSDPPPTKVVFDPLATRAATLTRLRQAAAFTGTGEPDMERVVQHLGRGELLHRLPLRPRKRWGLALQVLADRSRRLIPYWTDQELVAEDLSRLYPRDRLEIAVLPDGAGEPWLSLRGHDPTVYRMPEPGAHVLVLGDLGCLARDQDAATAYWLEWGRRFRDNGNPPLALLSCHPDRCPPHLTEVWTIIPWERPFGPAPGPASTERLVRRILSLLSFALRVEPRMIRAVRRMLPECRWDPGIESLVWQADALATRHSEAATFDGSKAEELREERKLIEPEQRRAVYELVSRMRQDTYPGIWCAELLALEQEIAGGLIEQAELRRAVEWFKRWTRSLKAREAYRDRASDQATWSRRVLGALPSPALSGAAGDILHDLWTLVHTPDSSGKFPGFLDPRKIPADLSLPVRTMALVQVSDRIVVRTFAARQGTGSLIGLIRTRDCKIRLEPDDAFWEGGIRPQWAIDWGRDPFGAWATFQVGDVTQKLRWIPPGRFVMGSPEDEAGRFDDEGPQHKVTIERGFWMIETPCTQALWEAVMGNNPSRFRGEARPVDQVSWDEVQGFLRRIAELVPGLRLELPREEQWEYACRAGSTAARYGNADEIAWYFGDSGGETHPVAEKSQNAWGLYDMLGNVWEWCDDLYRRYGSGQSGASAGRVLRGGSWDGLARYVRAACRLRFAPGYRHDYFGFRCAELRSAGPASRVERVASRSERRAEPRGDDEPASGARGLDLAGRPEAEAAIPAVVPLRIISDLEQLTIAAANRPPWASDIGRDEYGLWAEFRLADKLRQRLRWIPPGRFLMGSPEHEEGRYEAEGPQHEMTIERGFWMFATACTQELWEAVMGENPSHFRSPTRPVERVSWDDCQKFVAELNGQLEGLELSLPSEAQWEYACRAGTETATYAGDLVILGERNAPVLDRIAWYGGNCGVEFDLPDGWDSSKWDETQHKFERAGTRSVGLKQCNAWGLHDMLGNVWEWCADRFREYGKSEEEASADRGLRGGSWNGVARFVRAACRGRGAPGFRSVSIGFRCAEFRVGRELIGGRAGSGSERRAEPQTIVS